MKHASPKHFISNVDTSTLTADCSVCGRAGVRRNGRYFICKVKYDECQQRYCEENKDLLRQKARARLHRRYGDPVARERILESNRSYRLRNPDKMAAQNKKWRVENKDRSVALANRRRGLKHTTQSEVVSRREVYERDEATCGICGTHVDWEDFHVDHIVPLSRGGTHTYDNVQCAHAECNQRKHAKMDFVLQKVALA